MESLNKNINIPDNRMDNSRRFENVREELLDYQLQYLEKIDNGSLSLLPENIKSDKNRDFIELIKDYSSLPYMIGREFRKRLPGAKNISHDDLVYKEGFIVGIILKQINELRENDPKKWREGIKKIIIDNLNNVGPEINNGEDDKKNKAGIVSFEVESVKNLSEYGIDKRDDCISIHFEEFFKQKKENPSVSLFSVRESFSELALEIIEKYPEVKAIVARSWLMDSVGSSIGFNVHKTNKKVMDNDGFWGQFIDEKGEINKERMQKFLNTGEADFYSAEGFIKTEDFLKKYLPKEKRGKIELKEITEDSKNFREAVFLIGKELDGNWDKLSYEEIVSIVTKNQELSDYFKTEDGQGYLDIIKKVKDLNLERSDIDGLDFENKNEIKKKFDDFIKEKSNQYIEKEVFIP